MERNQVNEIMENYKNQEKKICKVGKNTEYLNKLEQIKEQTIMNNKINLHLERLEEELSVVDDNSIKAEYNKQINETKEQLKKENYKLLKLEQEKEKMIVEKKRNEKVVREAVKNKVNELQDKTRKELVAKKNEIDLKIKKNKLAYDTIKIQMAEFKYEYDENGDPVNGDDFKNMQEDLIKIDNQTKEMQGMLMQCEEYRKQLIDPYKMLPELPDDKIYIGDFKEFEKNLEEEEKEYDIVNKNANEKETVANEKNIDNDVETKAKKEKLDSLKTKAKENNETESKSENNGFRTYDTVNGFRVAKDNVKINEGEGKENLANEEVENEKIEKGNIDEIIINEGNGEVVISFKDGRKLNRDLNEILEEKKDTYIKENVKEICENIAGSKIRGLLLRTKINPAIIDVLSKYSDSDMIQEYVECLNEKRKMPFDLVHDLRDSKLGVINKLKMWVHAKAEDKIPGTKVTFAGMFWNKNKAIAEKSEVKNERESAEQTEAKRDKVQDRIKVDNKDNKLEHTANSNLDEKETQEKIAESVKEIMDEEQVL